MTTRLTAEPCFYVRRDGHHFVVVSVKDSGYGIPADDQPKILKIFFARQLSGKMSLMVPVWVCPLPRQSLSNPADESGSIPKNIAAQLLPSGCHLAVWRQSLGQRRFNQVEIVGQPCYTRPMTMSNGTSVLIVEDEASLLQALVDVFGSQGFTVLSAGDGQAGLTIARQKHPDIILLDVIMPKMDGLAMLKELRTDSWGKGVPVIILTNLSDYRTVADALGHGVHDFLVKSDWEIHDVVKAVKQKLHLK